MPTNTSPWNTSLIFNFLDEETRFRFLVSTVTLEEVSPEYSGAGKKTFNCLRLLIAAFIAVTWPFFLDEGMPGIIDRLKLGDHIGIVDRN